MLDREPDLECRQPGAVSVLASTRARSKWLAAAGGELTGLIVFGDKNTLLWTRQGEEQQQDNFGSSDKSTVFIANAGHFVMFEKTAPLFRASVSSWLDS